MHIQLIILENYFSASAGEGSHRALVVQAGNFAADRFLQPL